MADKNNTIKTTVVLDSTQAQQQIVKLNAVASDSTKSLEDRIDAKNKAVDTQNKLSKQTINGLEKEVKSLKGVEGQEKNLEKAENKLNSARLKATKLQESGSKQQRKLNQAYKDGKNPVKNLDKATGGLISKMKLFLANPIGILLSALVGLFMLVKKSMNATEDGAASFNAVMAALGQVFTNIITVVSDLLQPALKWLAEFLSKDLSGTFQAMGGYVDAVKLGFEAFVNIIKLGLTPFRSLIALTQAAALAIKGDFDGAKKVMTDFKQSVIDAAVAIKTNLNDALDTVVETNENVKKSFDDAGTSTDNLIAKAAQIELRQNAFNKSKRAQLLLDAKLAVISREAKADAKDKSKSDKERQAALELFSKTEDERQIQATARLNEEIKLKKDRLSLGKNTAQDEDELNNLLIERELLMEKNAKKQGVVNAMMGEFVLQRGADVKKEIAAQIELESIEIERLRNKNELTLENEIEFLEKKRNLELENVDLTETQKEVIRQKFEDAAQEVKDAKTEAEKEEAQIKLDTEIMEQEAELERMREHGNNVLGLELELLDKKMNQELNNEELTEAERAAIKSKYAIIRVKTEETANSAIKKSVDAAAQFGAEAMADAFGLSQELKTAQMIMSAPEAIGNSFTKASEAYAPPVSLAMGALGAAGVIVPILKGLSDIKKTRFSGGKGKRGGGGQNVSSPSGIVSSMTSSAVTDIAANNSARLGIDPSLGAGATGIAAGNVTGGVSQGVVFSESSYNDFQGQVDFKESKTTIG